MNLGSFSRPLRRFALLILVCLVALSLEAADKKIVFIAGTPSHADGEHEYRAGCLLLKKCIDRVPGVTSIVHSNGWPDDPNAFNDAAAILLYADGGPRHPFLQDDHAKVVADFFSKGVGLGCLHFAVEIPKVTGGPQMLQWLGGYYEVGFSINPVWTPEFAHLPEHAISRGVQPFSLQDEWYFNIRFRPAISGITPILTATPSDKVRLGPYSKRYPDVEKDLGRRETFMWACERPDGGRGFGFTGAHFHKNWANDNFRKVILNAILWMAKADVPRNGVESSVTEEDLKQNLDDKSGKKK